MVAFQRGFKSRANKIALGLRSQLGLSKTAPLDPRDVLHRFSIRIVPLSEFQRACPGETAALLSHTGGFSAMLLQVEPGKRIVIHNDSHSLETTSQQLGSRTGSRPTGPPRREIVCMGDLARRTDSLVEAEAAYLGGCILVSNEAAYRIAFSGIDSQQRPRTVLASARR